MFLKQILNGFKVFYFFSLGPASGWGYASRFQGGKRSHSQQCL